MPRPPQQPTDGVAAFQVLTNLQLFHPIVSWSAGWPGLVVHTLLQTKADTTTSDKVRDAAARLLRDGDMRTLALAGEARWYVRGELTRFTFTDVDLAIQAGNGDAVRLAFESTPMGAVSVDRFYWLWSLAVTHYPGHCRVLEVLKVFVTPNLGGRRSPFSADFMLRIKHVAVARWFIETYGPTSLPRNLIDVAAKSGNAGLFYFLLKTRGQDLVFLKDARKDLHSPLIQLLVKLYQGKLVFRGKLVSLVVNSNDAGLIELVLPDFRGRRDQSLIVEARDQLLRKQEARQLRLDQPRGEWWRSQLDQVVARVGQLLTGLSST